MVAFQMLVYMQVDYTSDHIVYNRMILIYHSVTFLHSIFVLFPNFDSFYVFSRTNQVTHVSICFTAPHLLQKFIFNISISLTTCILMFMFLVVFLPVFIPFIKVQKSSNSVWSKEADPVWVSLIGHLQKCDIFSPTS